MGNNKKNLLLQAGDKLKLKPRLATVAKLIPPGKVVVDIGSDHGCLPAYLVMENISSLVVATDKSKVCLEKARQLLELFNLSSQVKLRWGDGLQALKCEDRPEVVVIAGMGASSIMRILQRDKSMLSPVKCLVLQPMGEEYLLRRWLITQEWYFSEEKLAYERGHYYQIIKAMPGKSSYIEPFQLEIGPKIIENKDPLLAPYLECKIDYFRSIVMDLENKTSGRARKRYRFFQEKIKRFEEVLAIAGKDRECNATHGPVGTSIPGHGR